MNQSLEQLNLTARLQEVKKAKYCPIFVTGTGTDVGKTYITANIAKAIKDCTNAKIGYYKAAISGEKDISLSDAGYVRRYAGLEESDEALTHYLFEEAVSPHLAAAHKGISIDIEKVLSGFAHVYTSYELTILEGSGGIYCPLGFIKRTAPASPEGTIYPKMGKTDPVIALESDPQLQYYTVCDFMRLLSLSVGLKIVVVASSGLGCINNVVTTIKSLEAEGFSKEQMSIVLNSYKEESVLQQDNVRMIELMTGVKIMACIAQEGSSKEFTPERQLTKQSLKKLL